MPVLRFTYESLREIDTYNPIQMKFCSNGGWIKLVIIDKMFLKHKHIFKRAVQLLRYVEELPLFVLPMVLLPGEIQELRVFEPRYRQMLDDCLWFIANEFSLIAIYNLL